MATQNTPEIAYKLWECYLAQELIISQIRVDRGLFVKYSDAVDEAKRLGEHKSMSCWEIELVDLTQLQYYRLRGTNATDRTTQDGGKG